MAIVILVVLVLAVFMGVYHIINRERRLTGRLLPRSKKSNVLFVTAHPDDECMFFSPSILSMLNWVKYDVFLLCLSRGNFYQQGDVREKELLNSCSTLGIKKQNIILVDNSGLEDNPRAHWNSKLVSKVILKEVLQHKINLVFTFDEYGVSGHANHRAVYHGVRQLLLDDNCPLDLKAFKLISTNMLRKYLSVADTFFSYMTCKVMFSSPWLNVWKAQSAMVCHWSQFVWFRVLYIIFSRYMIINTYDIIEPPMDFS